MESITENINPEIEKEISEMFEADQADRREDMTEEEGLASLEADRQRLTRVKEIYADYSGGKFALSKDGLFAMAIIFQHGDSEEDYRNAEALAAQAGRLGHDDGAWLAAAAEDRRLLSLGKKQRWGTQVGKDEAQESWKTLPIEPDEESGITDEMRERIGVETTIEREERINKMNKSRE